MASGFFALLDDIAMLAKAAATSLDDVALAAGKATAKTAGVVVDDMAVSPQYVQGLSPKRELPVVWKIALGSFRNKFLIIIPLAMILSWLAPGVLPYLLIVGGLYLSFEGAEKVLSWFGLVKHNEEAASKMSGEALEKSMVSSAVRTDLILSTEIMLIALASVDEANWVKKLLMLLLIGLLMTVVVYGVVAVLVKLDDVGLHMAQKESRGVKAAGLSIIKVMPNVFKTLTVVGTIAMLWVGGHLAWKSLGDVGLKVFSDSLHSVEGFFHNVQPVLGWCGETFVSTLFGLLIGGLLFAVIHPIASSLEAKKLSKELAKASQE